MIEKFLPGYIMKVIGSRLDVRRLYEIRLRASRPVTVNYGGRYYYLNRTGLGKDCSDALTTDAATINDVVVRASDFSLYAVYDAIAGGFITVDGGVRIGIAGEAVTDGGRVRTLKNFGSVNIRVPHEIRGCADALLPFITEGGVRNTLIVSPPGCGKTTYLRDIARVISSGLVNVLIADERAEIAAVRGGVPQLDAGINCDVLTGCGKGYAFGCGIRSLRPDVIVTDELTPDDFPAAEEAMLAGVKLIASMHGAGIADVTAKPGFGRLADNRLFDRYAILGGVGELTAVYDGNREPLPPWD